MRLNTFDAVADWYKRTTPMRGAMNAGKDIRPIGDRSRKWERIIKISDNCYALSDGFHYGDNYYRTGDKAPTLKEVEFYCPIVWRKHRDGTETIKVRNGTGPNSSHMMRYAFLKDYLPAGLRFEYGERGMHFIRTSLVGDRRYLAKGTTVPYADWLSAKQTLSNLKSNPSASTWQFDNANWKRRYDDKAALVFTRVDGGFVYSSGGVDDPKAVKKAVDKAAKAKMKPHTDAFREWASAILPMLPISWEYERQLRDEVRAYCKENNVSANFHAFSIRGIMTPTLARRIFKDEEHPLRVALAVSMRNSVGSGLDKLTRSEFLTYYNKWVNQTLNLVKEKG